MRTGESMGRGRGISGKLMNRWLLGSSFKPHFLFQLFHHIKNNGASLIMHKGGKEPVFEMGKVKGRKFFATLKAVFIHTAFIITEEGAGHAVHDHESAAAFFEVFPVESFAGLTQVLGEVVGFRIIDQYHQAFAAITAIGAADTRTDGFIEPENQFIYLFAVPFFYKRLKPLVLGLMGGRKSGYLGQVGLNMWFFCFDGAKLSFTACRCRLIQVFCRFIHILRPFVEK